MRNLALWPFPSLPERRGFNYINALSLAVFNQKDSYLLISAYIKGYSLTTLANCLMVISYLIQPPGFNNDATLFYDERLFL